MKKALNFIMLFIAIQIGLKAQTGNNLFDDTYIHEIHLDFMDNDFLSTMYDLYNTAHALSENPDYIIAAITIDGNEITSSGNTLDTVGIRMKGDFSFAITPNDKKPFKIDINEFVSGQKYDGLKKFNLAPSAGDPSFLREKIGYELLESLGVIAPRCSFAKVYLNNEYWGLYQIIEQIDKSFLNDRFGNKDGNLFKSKGSAFLQWIDDNQGTYEDEEFPIYELKTNKTENDWSDFIAFMKLIDNTPNTEFKETLESNFNVLGFLKYLVVQNYTMNNDNYYQGGNNYYIYHNSATQKWEWIPWDLNYSMTDTNFGVAIFTPQSLPMIESSMVGELKILTKRILDNAEFQNQYYNEVCQFVNNAGAVTAIHNRIDQLVAMISDDVYADTRKAYSNLQFDDNVAYNSVNVDFVGDMYGIKYFTENRVNKLSTELTDLGITSCMPTTSINNSPHQAIAGVSLNPNPASNILTVTTNRIAEYDIVVIKVVDILGKELINVERELIDEISINVNSLVSGTYILLLQTKKGRFFREKFIKQ